MRIIRGKYGRRRFDPPKNITARPTTDFAKENLFNVLENFMNFEGKTALDLFAGTGSISLELLSRGCKEVTAVEMAQTQVNFIKSVKSKLNEDGLRIIKGDVFKFIQTCHQKFDFIFADPPYEHERFDEIPSLILNSDMVKEGTVVVVEHSGKRDFSSLPYFDQQRQYGSVNFTIFLVGEKKEETEGKEEKND